MTDQFELGLQAFTKKFEKSLEDIEDKQYDLDQSQPNLEVIFTVLIHFHYYFKPMKNI